MNSTNSFQRSVINLVAVLVTIGVNILATTLPLNNRDTGEISDQYPVLTTPAGYAFSIWSLIYLGLIVFAFFQIQAANRDNPRVVRITPLFWLSCICNIGWLFTWHYEILWLNIIFMLVLLVSLIQIYLRLRAGSDLISSSERWMLWAPFSLYLGWVTVATIVNISVVLYAAGWQDTGTLGAILAAVVFLVAAGIGTLVVRVYNDYAYSAVIIWALVAIALKHSAVLIVTGAAWLAVLIVAAAMIATLMRGEPFLTQTT
jgi:benzodiazapine receptor